MSVTPRARAANYTYKILYGQNSSAPLNGFTAPSLNDSGVVVFKGTIGSSAAIFRGDGGPVTTIATVGSTYTDLSPYPGINNSGTVVFSAKPTSGSAAIFTSSGPGQATKINGSLTGNFVTDLGVPAINDGGQVVFNAFDNTNQLNVYVGNGGQPLQVGSQPSASSDINNAGAVVYSTSFTTLRASSGVTTTIASNAAPFTSYNGAPAINSSGTIVFGGFNGSIVEVGKYDGSSSTIIVSPQNGFSSGGLEPGINDRGDILFRGTSAFGNGIYIGLDAAQGPVISQGMSLFGSTISEYGFFRHGFNNSGQLAFAYFLTNGQSGIALATPVPEPMSIAAFGVGMLSVLLGTIRRRIKTGCD
jgi:hypothetical protein